MSLAAALTAKARGPGGRNLVIQADRRVRHGTVVDVMNKALTGGIRVVNLAAAEE